MKLDPIGLIEDPELVDAEPITIPVCGFNRKTKKSVCEEFNFVPTLPWGNTFDLIESAERGANIMAGNTVKWLRNCLIDDEEREHWREFLASTDVLIEQNTVEGVYQAVAEVYAARPTLPRTGSTGTGDSTTGTSKGASKKRASRSGNKQ